MEGLVYAANGLYVASYFVGDILRLRILTVTAASCLATYFYTLPDPMWTVFGWNLFFVGLNLFQIGRHLRSRTRDIARPVQLSPAKAGRHPGPHPEAEADTRISCGF